MNAVIYHNPRCSKSRETLQLVEGTDASIDIVEYLKHPPSAEEIDRLCTLLGLEPVELIRPREKRLKEIGVSKRDVRSRAEWLKILAENPILIERPIVVVGDKAALGRPPASVLDIF